MKDFFFAPIGPIFQDFAQVEDLWNSTEHQKILELLKVKFEINGRKTSSQMVLRDYFLLKCDQKKVLDLRNLYVQYQDSSSLVLQQIDYIIKISFSKRSYKKLFMEIARRYIIRSDMSKTYKFDLKDNKDRVGIGGFGDVRVVVHRSSKKTFALKTIQKRRIKNKRSSANSIR